MAAQQQWTMPTAHPCDPTVSRRIDWIVIHYEAQPPHTIGRAWWRLQKLIAERHVPAYYPGEVRA